MIEMTKIKCYFIANELDSDAQLDTYRPYFEEYSAEVWGVVPGEAAFLYETHLGLESALFILDNGTGSFSVRLDVSVLRKSFYSVGSMDTMGDFIDAGDDQFAPVGSFVAPAVAWMAVEDFFTSPLECSPRLTWMDTEDMEWPASLG